LAVQFLVALLPAILVEIIVLQPVQDTLESTGFKNDQREYVTGSEDSIAVQIPYDPERWIKHRANPDRYWNTVSGLFGRTTLLPRLQGPLFVLNVVSAAVLFYSLYLVPAGYMKLALPALPFTISSFALGLLLVFRVNNATNRYVKARDLWGDMLNISRDLIQQASQWADREDFIDFARWVPAFTTGLMCQLRDPRKHDIAQELREAAGSDLERQGEGAGLTEEEIQLMCSRPNGMLPAHYVTHMLRIKIKAMGLPLEQRLMMESNVTRLINDMGACENIFATPIPVGYTKHTSRFLFLWLFFLPWALTEQLGVGTIFAQQVLSFGLLGIEDVGIQIEEPFSVLPLKKICFKISNEAQIVRSFFDYLEDQGKTSKEQQTKELNMA